MPTSVTPHVAIPIRDGTLLSGAFHWPEAGPDGGPYPALIEYHPYRKDDKSSARAPDHDYFAQNGFVSIRLDVRGTGSSQGVNTDEYMPVETQDGYDAVEWLAAQDWCNGNVGMFGSSYGGFTSYQVAMLRPPSLKAIVPIYATDDRYTDDCHYKGGMLKGYYDVATYGTMMVAINGLPPDPELFGDGWEPEWERRLEKTEHYMEKWLDNQRDGEYWRPGSLRGQYEKLQAATFIISGWQDGYPNPPLRAFQNINCQKKVLIGPWNHSRPDVALPGPRIDYLNEMRRWFDLHLKDVDDGISSEPPVTVFVQDYDRPDPSRTDTTGSWHSENSWPPQSSGDQVFYLGGAEPAGGHRLADKPVVSDRSSSLKVDPAVGITGGLWSGGLPFGLPGDQRRDEALSLTYTTMPLQDEIVIAGNPVLEIAVSSDKPMTLFVAKLADVAPDGSSALVSRGVLNGTRRNGLNAETQPEPMAPHEPYRLRIELDATAWRFERGHRVRLAISGADFPNMWPAPENATITVNTGGAEQSTLKLPLLTGEGVETPDFAPSRKPTPVLDMSSENTWDTRESPFGGEVSLEVNRSSETQVREGVVLRSVDGCYFTVSRENPAKASITGRSHADIQYGRTPVRVRARQEITSDETYFHWSVSLRVSHDNQVKLRRNWKHSFPRDLM